MCGFSEGIHDKRETRCDNCPRGKFFFTPDHNHLLLVTNITDGSQFLDRSNKLSLFEQKKS